MSYTSNCKTSPFNYCNCCFYDKSLGGHRLIFRSPSGCDRSNCDYYVGLSPNAVDSTYLDVYLEGTASGWIAIGFSLNTQMVV